MTRVSDDDEAEIEAQIRRELEALGNDSLDLQDLEQGASLTSTEQVLANPFRILANVRIDCWPPMDNSWALAYSTCTWVTVNVCNDF